MVSVMQDDNQTRLREPGQRRNALDRMKGLGVEAVRVTMLWREIAPDSDGAPQAARVQRCKSG